MADQKCARCGGLRGFEIVQLEGCQGVEVAQCKLCGSIVAVVNTPIKRKFEELVERLDLVLGKLQESR